MSNYTIKYQRGGASAPWHDGGTWTIGSRANQLPLALQAASNDGGKTLIGTMTYAGEGPIGVRATRSATNTYQVTNQWGGDSAPWNPGGTFVLGDHLTQPIVALSISSTDDGKTLVGTATYAGEGPIGFAGKVSAIQPEAPAHPAAPAPAPAVTAPAKPPASSRLNSATPWNAGTHYRM